jgi:hypothetical protein
MTTDGQVLAIIDQAFGSCRRPESFIVDWEASKECSEYEKRLRARSVETLTRNDVGDIGRDPLNFISPEGFLYFFPALARLALQEPAGNGSTWFGERLPAYLTNNLSKNKHLKACNEAQKRAVVTLLDHLKRTRFSHFDEWVGREDLRIALEIWSSL